MAVRLPHHLGVQGNVDPGLLFGTPEAIRARIDDTVRKAGGRRHILNLGPASCWAHRRKTVPPSLKLAKP